MFLIDKVNKNIAATRIDWYLLDILNLQILTKHNTRYLYYIHLSYTSTLTTTTTFKEQKMMNMTHPTC